MTFTGNNEMNSIRKDIPATRQELTQFVSEFWEQCGFSTRLDCEIETVQGLTSMVVCAYDGTNRADPVFLCECRYWSDPVPDNIIQGVETFFQRSGAKSVFILSKTTSVNIPPSIAETVDVNLSTWQEFQGHFSQQWVRFQTDNIQQNAEDIGNYCDPLETYVSARLKKASDDFREQYKTLSDKYMPMGILAHKWNLPNTLLRGGELFEVFNCLDAWYFMIKLDAMLKEGLKEFDNLFNEKWWK